MICVHSAFLTNVFQKIKNYRDAVRKADTEILSAFKSTTNATLNRLMAQDQPGFSSVHLRQEERKGEGDGALAETSKPAVLHSLHLQSQKQPMKKQQPSQNANDYHKPSFAKAI
jgi:hypothetical protein